MNAVKWLTVVLAIVMTVGCTVVRNVSETINDSIDYNRGTLVGVPSMSLQEVRERSTFDLGEGFVSSYSTSKEEFLSKSYRFDWELPNSQVKFKDCAGYTIRTDSETGKRVVRMLMFTGRKYFTWSEVKAEAYQVEQMLINDGWQAHEWQGESLSKKFHRELENPNFNIDTMKEVVADVSYEKDGLQFIFVVEIAKKYKSRDVTEGENFIHRVTMNDIKYKGGL